MFTATTFRDLNRIYNSTALHYNLRAALVKARPEASQNSRYRFFRRVGSSMADGFNPVTAWLHPVAKRGKFIVPLREKLAPPQNSDPEAMTD